MASQRERLEKVLRGCAEAGVPDTVDLWPAVNERVTGRRAGEERTGERIWGDAIRRRARAPQLVPDSFLGWTLAGLSVLILCVGAYAASGPVRELLRQGPPGAVESGPGREAGRNLGTRPDKNLSALRTELDLTKAAGGVRVTLDWAYADERFVAVNLDTRALEGARKPGESGSDDVLEPSLWDDTVGDEAELPPYVKISDKSGQDFDTVGGGTGLGSRLTAAEAVFDAPEGLAPGRKHRFRLEVPLREAPQRVGQRLEKPGPFVFVFEIPVRPAPTVEVDQKVEDEGITITLERVIDSPVLPQAVVCFEPPDGGLRWTPWLKDDGYSIPGQGEGSEGILTTAPQKLGGGCWSLMLGRAVEARSSVTVARLESIPGSSSDPDEPLMPKVIRGPWTFELGRPGAPGP